MSEELQRRLEAYRDKQRLTEFLASLYSMEVVETIAEKDLPLTDNLYSFILDCCQPISTLKRYVSGEELARWVAPILELGEITSQFYMSRVGGWLQVRVISPEQLIEEFIQKHFTNGKSFLNWEKTKLVWLVEDEHTYGAFIVTVSDMPPTYAIPVRRRLL